MYLDPKMIHTAMTNVLAYMRENPSKLEEKPMDLMKALDAYMNSSGQGSGNKVSPHEACIASVLETFGFVRAPRGEYPTADGLYYWYQLGNTQRSGDFLLFEIREGKTSGECILDAKHSNTTNIYLNDGTFERETIYIVSFTRTLSRVKGQRSCPREHVCFIGRGQDIFTEKDRAALDTWRAAIRAMNQLAQETDHLRLYARSANQYDCRRFTPEFTTECWETMLASFQPSVEQTEQEPHSQSV